MIFVNGDSVTWGSELSTDDMDYIKTHRYSHHISEKFGEVINLSKLYNNNDTICRESIEWLENNSPDFVIIQWSPLKRFEWYDGKKWRTIAPNDTTTRITLNHETNKFEKKRPRSAAVAYYSEIENDYVSQKNFWSNVHHLECYLDKRNIPHYFWYGKGSPKETKKLPDLDVTYRNISKWGDMLETCEIIGNSVETDHYTEKESSILSSVGGKKMGGHPNERGHELLAEHICDFIQW